MCQLESCPVVPSEEGLDVVDGALDEVIEDVLTDQVKQQFWECVVAALRRAVQWGVERVQAWRQRV